MVDSKYSSDLSYSMNSTAGSMDKTPLVVPIRTGHIVAELTSFECNGSESRLFSTKLDFSSSKSQEINHAISIHRQSRSSGNPRINMANNCRFSNLNLCCVFNRWINLSHSMIGRSKSFLSKYQVCTFVMRSVSMYCVSNAYLDFKNRIHFVPLVVFRNRPKLRPPMRRTIDSRTS